MCFSRGAPQAQTNTPSYSVAQMGDQYEVTKKPAEEEEQEKATEDDISM
jgi:hypothetical protein